MRLAGTLWDADVPVLRDEDADVLVSREADAPGEAGAAG